MFGIKKNIETEVKIIGIGIIFAGLSLFILNIYSIYLMETVELSDIFLILFGISLLIAGFGIVKMKNWARKMMLYIIIASLSFGLYELIDEIRWYISFTEIDYYSSMSNILFPSLLFVVGILTPVVYIFYLLNRKEIKELFRNKVAQNQPTGELAGA